MSTSHLELPEQDCSLSAKIPAKIPGIVLVAVLIRNRLWSIVGSFEQLMIVMIVGRLRIGRLGWIPRGYPVVFFGCLPGNPCYHDFRD